MVDHRYVAPLQLLLVRFDHFDPSRFLFVLNDDLHSDPQRVINQVTDFIGLPNAQLDLKMDMHKCGAVGAAPAAPAGAGGCVVVVGGGGAGGASGAVLVLVLELAAGAGGGGGGGGGSGGGGAGAGAGGS